MSKIIQKYYNTKMFMIILPEQTTEVENKYKINLLLDIV
jgi:hypothetical protein